MNYRFNENNSLMAWVEINELELLETLRQEMAYNLWEQREDLK